MIELCEDGADAVETESTGMVGRRNELRAKCVHLGKWADHTCVAEVVGELATGEAGARSGFHTDEVVVGLTTQNLTEEW